MWESEIFTSIKLITEIFQVQMKEIFMYLSQPWINFNSVHMGGQW